MQDATLTDPGETAVERTIRLRLAFRQNRSRENGDVWMDAEDGLTVGEMVDYHRLWESKVASL